MKKVKVGNRIGETTSIIPHSTGLYPVWFAESKEPEFIQAEEVNYNELAVKSSNEHVENLFTETIFRPKTIKDLVDALKNGNKCELPSSTVERTNRSLDGHLLFKNKYITYLSKNIGWVIYESVKP